MKKSESKLEIQKELTPELADKIWKSIQKKKYDDKVSRDLILHHLKQLKAEIGREKASYRKKELFYTQYSKALDRCSEMISNKIKKICQ